MAELWRGGHYPPYEVGPRLALLLDLALQTGRSPLELRGEATCWREQDLEVVSQWKAVKDDKCPGCGRPLATHLHNPVLGRAETADDYTAYSLDCPAMQAIAEGQDMWREAEKAAIQRHWDGKGPDPGMGLYWLAQAPHERIPHKECGE